MYGPVLWRHFSTVVPSYQMTDFNLYQIDIKQPEHYVFTKEDTNTNIFS